MPSITNTYLSLLSDPASLTIYSGHMKELERLTVVMYSKNCSAVSQRHTYNYFMQSLDAISPSQAALFQHLKMCLFQALYVLRQATTAQQNIPAFDEWGRLYDQDKRQWKQYWTMLEDASKACALLFHCGCKNNARINANAAVDI